MAADRRRYARTEIESAASVSTDGERWLPVTLINESLVGFGGVTSSRMNEKPGHPILVQIEGFQDIPSILVWRRAEESFTRFGIRAIEFIREVCDDRACARSNKAHGDTHRHTYSRLA